MPPLPPQTTSPPPPPAPFWLAHGEVLALLRRREGSFLARLLIAGLLLQPGLAVVSLQAVTDAIVVHVVDPRRGPEPIPIAIPLVALDLDGLHDALRVLAERLPAAPDARGLRVCRAQEGGSPS